MSWPVPRDQIISAPRLVEEWDHNDSMKPGGGEREVRDMLEGLRVENGRSVLMAKKEEFERLSNKAVEWEHEPWYGTAYTVERYDEEFVKQAQGANDIPDLFLPGPNEFVPENLKVDKRDVPEVGLILLSLFSWYSHLLHQPEKRPKLVLRTALSELWHKKDDQWWVPKAQVILDIRT